MRRTPMRTRCEQGAPGVHAPPSEACAREGREGMPSPSTVRRHHIISDLKPDPTGLTSLRLGKTDHYIIKCDVATVW